MKQKSKIRAVLLAAVFAVTPIAHATDFTLEKGHTMHLFVDEGIGNLYLEGIVRDVRKQGFTCDTVSSVYYRSEKNILLECNKRKYAFAIIDYGGKRLVFVDSILHQKRDTCHLCDNIVGLNYGTRKKSTVMDAVRNSAGYPYSVLQIDEHGATPLTYAVESGNVEIVKILLDAGAIASAVNKFGCVTKEGGRIFGGYDRTPETADIISDMLSEAVDAYTERKCT